MSENLKDILNNSNKDIDNQKLMDYVSKGLSAQEAHDLEKQMADDDFMNDAIEGLEQINDNKKIGASVEELHQALEKQIAKKKNRKEKRKLKEQPWTFVAIIVILLLLLMIFLFFERFSKSTNIKMNEPAATSQYYNAITPNNSCA
jgi:hypothetical protein